MLLLIDALNFACFYLRNSAVAKLSRVALKDGLAAIVVRDSKLTYLETL